MIKQIYRFLNPRFQNLFLDHKVNLRPRYGYGKPAHQELYEIINSNRNRYKELIHKTLSLKEYIWSIKTKNRETDPDEPIWNNKYLPGLYITGIYTLLTEFRPKKYFEIGSGYSTKLAFKIKNEQRLKTEITSLDPFPRTGIDHLVDKIIREPLEDIDLNIFDELCENDILFVDNSHRILPNSDSMVFFLEVLPRLKKGVIVHVHDIYLPYDYPQFMCHRFYSEQYGLAILLLANPRKYEIILPNFFISEDKELSELVSPIWRHENLNGVEKHGGSFWIKINE